MVSYSGLTVVSGNVIAKSWADQVRDALVVPYATAAARSSAVTSPTEGMMSYLQDSDSLWAYDGTAWQLVCFIGQQTIVKAADETVTSSVTVQNDDALIAAVAASATYEVDLRLIYTAHGGSTTGQIKIGWAAPASATLNYIASGATIDTIPPGTMDVRAWTLTDLPSYGAAGTSTSVSLRATGVLVTSATAGNLQFMWAQANSDATSTVVKAKSVLMLRRIA